MRDRPGGKQRFLMLGPPQGWHAEQLRQAASKCGHTLEISEYESLTSVACGPHVAQELRCDRGRLTDFDAILTRTMPAASMERITFRLAVLHAIADRVVESQTAVVNPPRSLEWAIDKYASLARLTAMGLETPPTRFVQSRVEAMHAFEALGGDCVVKPLFGGEGRGVMRISDPQLAWTTFSTLDQLDAVLQVQQFISPGGSDMRLLVIGERVFGVRRHNPNSFRTNVGAGSVTTRCEVDSQYAETARRVTTAFGLVFASVDLIDHDHGPPMFLEVNAIPGWKAAQQVIPQSIAEAMIETLAENSAR